MIRSRFAVCAASVALTVAGVTQTTAQTQAPTPTIAAPPPMAAPTVILPPTTAPLPRPASAGTTSGKTTKTPPVTPHLEFNAMSDVIVRDIHLRPLYTTTIRVPEGVTSLVVGAPTLFEVEHKDSEPNLIFVKPATHLPAESNLLIALQSGATISVRLISPGDAGSTDATDFMADFTGRKSMFESGAVVLGTPGTTSAAHAVTPGSPVADHADPHASVQTQGASYAGNTLAASSDTVTPLDADSALSRQAVVGSPHWVTAPELSKMIKADGVAPSCIALAIGDIRQEGGNMVVSFSVLNISKHWVTIMPPQIELANPLLSKREVKKRGSFAQPIASTDYRLDSPKLSPGSRSDGSITFPKPATKTSHESLLLHIAISSAIDTPVYYPLPFVAPSSEELTTQQEGPNARIN